MLLGLQGDKVFCYLDDCLIFGKNVQHHNNKLRKVFHRLKFARVGLQPAKCEFLRDEVIYLGHVISEKGVSPDPKKIEVVKSYHRSTIVTEVRNAVGLFSYYSRFIESFSRIAKPLTNITDKDLDFVWGEEQQKAFDTLKEKLCQQPILAHPDPKSHLTHL